MSNTLAIAAATATLRSLLMRGGAPNVTVKPLDIARDGSNGDQVNLFLYQASIDAALRNQDMPRQVGSGETGQPPLPLCLYYLLTAFGAGDDETKAQQLLGQAMSVLHDHPLLGAQEIENATTTDVAGSDLHEQIERVRITPHPLSIEELSKLWTTFQTHYRISTAYEVSVVLIESKRRRPAALPVRIANIYTTTMRRPVIESVAPQVIAAGGVLTIEGFNLKGESVKVLFSGIATSPDPNLLSDSQLNATLPAGLRAGVNVVKVVHEFKLGVPPAPHPGAGVESNMMAFALAPRIVTAPPFTAARGATLSLDLDPPVGREQRVLLLASDQSAIAESRTAAETTTVEFKIPQSFSAGTFLLRVRVDGAESLLDVDTNQSSPTFNQYTGPKITIT